MKSLLFCLLCIALLSSCASDAPNKELPNAPEKKKTIKERDMVTILPEDTVLINGVSLIFRPADSATLPDFLQNQGIRISGGQMAYFHKEEKALHLLLENGDTLTLKDDPSGAAHYVFVAHLPRINYYLVRIQYPEGNEYLLVHRRSGFREKIIGLPYVSPAATRLLAINADLIAGHSPNGMQLLQVQGDTLASRFILDVRPWGPEGVAWSDEQSFMMKKSYLHIDTATGTHDYTYSFSAVHIKE